MRMNKSKHNQFKLFAAALFETALRVMRINALHICDVNGSDCLTGEQYLPSS